MAIDQKWVAGAQMIAGQGSIAIQISRTFRALYSQIKNIESAMGPLLVAGNTEGVTEEMISALEQSIYPSLYQLKQSLAVDLPAAMQSVSESAPPAIQLIDLVLPEGYTPPIEEPEVQE